MTDWLALIPHLPSFTGWATVARLAKGDPTW